MNGKYWDRPWSLIDGCTPCSPGCDHCWSMAMGKRFKKWPDRVTIRPDRLDIPLRTRKPTVFSVWNDLFHEDVPDEFIAAAVRNMSYRDQHNTFLLLTKRAEKMRDFFVRCKAWGGWITHNGHPPNGAYAGDGLIVGQEKESVTNAHRYGGKERLLTWPISNLWLGCTIVNQSEADEKIPLLLQTPAVHRWVSMEPMLGAIDLGCIPWPDGWRPEHDEVSDGIDPLRYNHDQNYGHIDAVILGGETGPGARPMHPDWARSVRNQCAEAGVPFFFKQWGEWAPSPDGGLPDNLPSSAGYYFQVPDPPGKTWKFGRTKAGRLLDGREHNELPWRK